MTRYPLGLLEETFQPTQKEKTSTAPVPERARIEPKGCGDEIPCWIQELMDRKPHIKRALLRQTPEGSKDASAADFHLCCSLITNAPEISDEMLSEAMLVCRSIAEDQPEKVDRIDYVERTIRRAREAAKLETAVVPENWLSRLGDLDLDGIPEELPWLVRDILHLGSFAILGGDPKGYKTLLSYHLSLAVVTGRKFLGSFDVGATGPVLIIAAEDREQIVVQRLRSIARSYGVEDISTLPIHVSCRRGFRLDDSNWLAALKNQASRIEPKLIVMDPLRAISNGNEDNSAEARQVARWANEISDICGSAVLIVHHYRKNNMDGARPGTRLRGSSDWYASVDTLLSVEKRGATTVQLGGEHRAAAALEPVTLEIIEAEGAVDFRVNATAGESIREQLIKAAEALSPAGTTKTDLARKAPGAKKTKLQIINTLIDEGRLIPIEGETRKTGTLYRIQDQSLEAVQQAPSSTTPNHVETAEKTV